MLSNISRVHKSLKGYTKGVSYCLRNDIKAVGGV